MLNTQQPGCASGTDCFRQLEKYKIWPFCLHLNSQVPLNCKDTSQYNCWMFQKYFRMLITQESGCASGMNCSQNLNSSLKNPKPELFIWNLMVKYWPDRVKFWINTAFKAFWMSHQHLSRVVVYRSNRGGWVWYFFPDAFCFRCTNSGLNQFCNHPNRW